MTDVGHGGSATELVGKAGLQASIPYAGQNLAEKGADAKGKEGLA